MMRTVFAGAARLGGILMLGAAGPAAAQGVTGDQTPNPDGLRIHAGPGVLFFDTKAAIRIEGVLASAASISIDPDPTLIIEIGYRRRHLGVSITGGVPPQATVAGAGILNPLGALGGIRYGPAVLTAQFYPKLSGRLQPYAGVGPVFLFIFKNHDAALDGLNVRNTIGAALQLGADYRLTLRWSLFVDAKRALLRTDATASLAGAPIQAHIRLDPTVLTTGLSYRF
ncbi:OmpW/AlkL family protein [Novosphingobium terrae]|uniref:OmpW/AlkL family protein n=1 Tax=Novosphingobium terrae TaxID=2726189 RepID=UPI00198119A7|nr:OmpW family outer membrane protein [Novosphingobium terrae]